MWLPGGVLQCQCYHALDVVRTLVIYMSGTVIDQSKWTMRRMMKVVHNINFDSWCIGSDEFAKKVGILNKHCNERRCCTMGLARGCNYKLQVVTEHTSFSNLSHCSQWLLLQNDLWHDG